MATTTSPAAKKPAKTATAIPAAAPVVAKSNGTKAARSASKSANKAAKPVSPRAPAAPSDAAPAQPKLKLVRDSFTIPKNEYAVLDELKQRAASLMRPTKKGELLRAGIAALQRMPDKAFLAAVNAVPSLKTGRPGNAVPEEPAAVAKKS